MYDASSSGFPQTARGRASSHPTGPPHQPVASALSVEGRSVRYTAIAGLGIAKLSLDRQQNILAGAVAADLVRSTMAQALAGDDPGAVALATWFAAEISPQTSIKTKTSTKSSTESSPAKEPDPGAEAELSAGTRAIEAFVRAGTAIPTVDQAWMLTALVGSGLTDGSHSSAAELVERLIGNQAPGGIFPHLLPPTAAHRLRRHVGCFADQVYPIQALARYAAATGDRQALQAANRCAQRIVDLQGPAGQWWWHYDARTSEVVEEYPVYSVHQHAMAPMALLELHAAGGDDHRAAIGRGLSWLSEPSESTEALVEPETGVIWRKIGRREPRKAMRSLRSVTTAVRPGLRFQVADRLFPATQIDRECRPYELGWLLYAWIAVST